MNVKSYGAQGDGISDDTAPLNSTFHAACTASEDVYIPTGTYVVHPLDTLNDCAVTIYGDGPDHTTLKLLAATSQPMWTFHGSPGGTVALAIQDLALDGGHLVSSGLAIEQYQAVSIDRVSIHDFGTPGYDLGHRKSLDGLYIRNVENVRIANSQFTGNERAGVELQAVHSSVVQSSTMSFNGGMGGVSEQNFEGPLDGPLVAQWLGNILIANGSGGIDVETDPKLAPVQGILRDNQVLDCGNDEWDAGWGLVLGLGAFGTIERNRLQNFAADAPPGDYTSAIVYGTNAGPIAINNNKITGTKSGAILGVNGEFPVAITGNILVGNGKGICIYNSPKVQITNNTVTDSAGVGISVFWSHGSTISGNQLEGNIRNIEINGRSARQGSRGKNIRPWLMS